MCIRDRIVTDKEGCTAEEKVFVFVNDCRKAQNSSEVNYISLQAKVLLQGAKKEGEALMHDQLRAKKLLPLIEPYTALSPYLNVASPFKHIRGGLAEIAPDVLKTEGSNAIVDWVFLELRWDQDPSKVLATRSALLQRDGDIVDIDGISPVRFLIPEDRYFVAVRHRNHLGAMSATAVSFSPTAAIDFTDKTESFYTLTGTSESSKFPMVLINGYNYLWGGNSNGDNKIIFQGPNLDREKILFDTALHPDNTAVNYNFIYNGYLMGDNNMDGLMIFQGSDNDVDELQFFNVLLHEENPRNLPNKIIFEQLPRKE